MVMFNSRIKCGLLCVFSLGVAFGQLGCCGEPSCVLQGVSEDGRWRIPTFPPEVTKAYLVWGSQHLPFGGDARLAGVRLVSCPETGLVFHFGDDSDVRAFSWSGLEEKAEIKPDDFLEGIILPEGVPKKVRVVVPEGVRRGGMLRFCQACVGLSDDGEEELLVLWSLTREHGAFVTRISPRGVVGTTPGAVRTLGLRIAPRAFSRLVWAGTKGVYGLLMSKAPEGITARDAVMPDGTSVADASLSRRTDELSIVLFSSRTGRILAENGMRIPGGRLIDCLAFAPSVRRGAMVLEGEPSSASDQKGKNAGSDEAMNFTLDGRLEESPIKVPIRSAEGAVYAGDGSALYLFTWFSMVVLECAEGKLTTAKEDRIRPIQFRSGLSSYLNPRLWDESRAETLGGASGWALSPSGRSAAVRAFRPRYFAPGEEPFEKPAGEKGQRVDWTGVKMVDVRSRTTLWARTTTGMGFVDSEKGEGPHVCWTSDSKGLVVGTHDRLVLLDAKTGDRLAAVDLEPETDRLGRSSPDEARGPRSADERGGVAVAELLWGVPMEVTLETVQGRIQLTRLAKSSALASFGLKEGDVIETLNGRVVRIEDAKRLDRMFEDAMQRMSRGEPSILKIRRGDNIVQIPIQ